MTLSITILSIKGLLVTLSIDSIEGLIVVLSIKDAKYKGHSAKNSLNRVPLC
jgi:hypothetical protein